MILIKRQEKIFVFIFITLLAMLLWVCLSTAFADTLADASTISKIRDTFKSEAEGWYVHFKIFAEKLFYTCALLEVGWLGIQVVLSRSEIGEQIKQFVLFIITAGLYLAIIRNYVPWLTDIRIWFDNVAGSAMKMDFNSLIDLPLMVAFNIMRLIGLATATLGVSDLGTIIGFYIAGFIVLICLALITAQAILIHCEFYVTTMAAFVLVGLGATSFLRDYAKNVLRYAFSACFKLFILNLLLAMGLKFINTYLAIANIQFSEVLTLMGIALVLLALIKSLPELVSGILSGSHTGSGLGLTTAAATMGAAAGAIGGAALGAASAVGGAAVGAGRAVQNLRDASNIANMQGKSGFGKVASMAQTMYGAHQNAKTESEKSLGSRTRSQMQERLMDQKAQSLHSHMSQGNTPEPKN